MKQILFSLGLLVAVSVSTVRAEDLAIIVGKDSALSEVTSTEVTKIFKCEKTKGAGGAKFIVVVQSAEPAREAALAKIYKMDAAGHNKYFLQATFTGAVAAAPKALSSGAAVKAFVAGTAGGIGYVKASEADDSVKVLKVDGKAPGEAGYPLPIK